MFFFFKQKTAYEMRISDWSSDVCSSDLQGTYASSGLPLSLLTPGTPAYQAVVDGGTPNREFEFRTTGNGPGASLKGVELSLQLPFSVFSDSLRHFGVLGNTTFVKSDVDYDIRGPLASDPDDNRLDRKSGMQGTRVPVRVHP